MASSSPLPPIRTDIFLEHIFGYMIRDQYGFIATSNMNWREKNAFEICKQVLNTFHNTRIKNLYLTIVDQICDNDLNSHLFTIAETFFVEDITWNHIATFFVFIQELTQIYIDKKFPKSTVNILFNSFSEIVKKKLITWIERNGHWEGMQFVKKERSTWQSIQFWFIYYLYAYFFLRIIIRIITGI